MVNAVLWHLRTGALWRGLPERCGLWKTAHERLREPAGDGTWERLLERVVVKDDAVGRIEWGISIDSTSVRVHQPRRWGA